jgi:hypothetical protein
MNQRTLQAAVEATVDDGESALVSCRGQLKQGDGAKRLAKDVAVSAAMTALSSAIGVGLFQVTSAPAVWIVATSRRLLVFERDPDLGKKAGDLIVAFHLGDLNLELRSGVLTEIRVDDRATGANMLRFNVGVNRSKARELLAAAQPS